MPKHKVLIDSSVWIEYFRSGEIPVLDRLIEEDLACTNELLLTELVPVLAHQRRHDIVEGLEALEVIPLNNCLYLFSFQCPASVSQDERPLRWETSSKYIYSRCLTSPTLSLEFPNPCFFHNFGQNRSK